MPRPPVHPPSGGDRGREPETNANRTPQPTPQSSRNRRQQPVTETQEDSVVSTEFLTTGDQDAHYAQDALHSPSNQPPAGEIQPQESTSYPASHHAGGLIPQYAAMPISQITALVDRLLAETSMVDLIEQVEENYDRLQEFGASSSDDVFQQIELASEAKDRYNDQLATDAEGQLLGPWRAGIRKIKGDYRYNQKVDQLHHLNQNNLLRIGESQIEFIQAFMETLNMGMLASVPAMAERSAMRESVLLGVVETMLGQQQAEASSLLNYHYGHDRILGEIAIRRAEVEAEERRMEIFAAALNTVPTLMETLRNGEDAKGTHLANSLQMFATMMSQITDGDTTNTGVARYIAKHGMELVFSRLLQDSINHITMKTVVPPKRRPQPATDGSAGSGGRAGGRSASPSAADDGQGDQADGE